MYMYFSKTVIATVWSFAVVIFRVIFLQLRGSVQVPQANPSSEGPRRVSDDSNRKQGGPRAPASRESQRIFLPFNTCCEIKVTFLTSYLLHVISHTGVDRRRNPDFAAAEHSVFGSERQDAHERRPIISGARPNNPVCLQKYFWKFLWRYNHVFNHYVLYH